MVWARDPESRKFLKTLDPGLRRDDDITTFVSFCKGLDRRVEMIEN